MLQPGSKTGSSRNYAAVDDRILYLLSLESSDCSDTDSYQPVGWAGPEGTGVALQPTSEILLELAFAGLVEARG